MACWKSFAMRLGLLSVLSGFVPLGTGCSDSLPPVTPLDGTVSPDSRTRQDAAPPRDSAVTPDSTVTPDGATPDAAVTPDITVVLPPRLPGELSSGGGISTGGNYALRSQVGHPVSTQGQSGGNYALHWNTAIIPW